MRTMVLLIIVGALLGLHGEVVSGGVTLPPGPKGPITLTPLKEGFLGRNLFGVEVIVGAVPAGSLGLFPADETILAKAEKGAVEEADARARAEVTAAEAEMAWGLSLARQETVRLEMDNRLRQGGIRVVTEADLRTIPATAETLPAALRLDIITVQGEGGQYAYYVRLKLYEELLISRINPEAPYYWCEVVTWNVTTPLRVVEELNFDQVIQDVRDAVDQFVADYRKAQTLTDEVLEERYRPHPLPEKEQLEEPGAEVGGE